MGHVLNPILASRYATSSPRYISRQEKMKHRVNHAKRPQHPQAFETVPFTLPIMTQVPSSTITPTNDDKNAKGYEPEVDISAGDTLPAVEKDVASEDGDDALRLAGTHAHQFDEKYYLALRRKIVSPPKTDIPVEQASYSLSLGSPRHATSGVCLLHPVLG